MIRDDIDIERTFILELLLEQEEQEKKVTALTDSNLAKDEQLCLSRSLQRDSGDRIIGLLNDNDVLEDKVSELLDIITELRRSKL